MSIYRNSMLAMLAMVAGGVALAIVPHVQAADAAPTKAAEAQMMKDCVTQELRRNNTGKAAAEVTCKEKKEVQQEVDRAPEDRPAASGMDGASAAGHSSHSVISSEGATSTERASQSAPAPKAAPATPAAPSGSK